MLTAATRHWWVFIVQGILGILFGVLALIYPGIALLTFAYLFAAWAIVSGVTQIFEGWRVAEQRGRSWPFALMGVVSIAAGLIAAFLPGITIISLAIILGAWLVVFGVIQVYTAWHIRKEISDEWVLALVGVLTVILGLGILAFPVFGAVLGITFVAVSAIVGGVMA